MEKTDYFNPPTLMMLLSCARDYLDGATLNALSGTCKWIRKNIYNYFPTRYIVYRNWKKKRHVDGRIEWFMGEEVKLSRYFSNLINLAS
jgi:hypothetical protein